MLNSIRVLLIAGTILLLSPFFTTAADDEMVDNPLYRAWARFKPGSTAVLAEKTVFGEGRKPFLPEGADEKVITHKLLKVTPDHVVIQTIVTEQEFLGTVESAPTKTTYSAKIKKDYLDAALEEFEAKAGEETVKVLGKEIKCKTLSGTHKKGDEQVEFKLRYTDMVPGGIVSRSRITREGGKLVAETIVTLKEYKAE